MKYKAVVSFSSRRQRWACRFLALPLWVRPCSHPAKKLSMRCWAVPVVTTLATIPVWENAMNPALVAVQTVAQAAVLEAAQAVAQAAVPARPLEAVGVVATPATILV